MVETPAGRERPKDDPRLHRQARPGGRCRESSLRECRVALFGPRLRPAHGAKSVA